MINTITSKQGRPAYLKTKKSHDKEDQDTRNPKAVAKQTLAHLYNNPNGSYNELDDGGAGDLIGFSVLPDVCKDCGKLNFVEVNKVIN